jgi:hypothetical protein
VHLVFVPKYRRCVLSRRILDSMRVIFAYVCNNDFEAGLVEFDGGEKSRPSFGQLYTEGLRFQYGQQPEGYLLTTSEETAS